MRASMSARLSTAASAVPKSVAVARSLATPTTPKQSAARQQTLSAAAAFTSSSSSASWSSSMGGRRSPLSTPAKGKKSIAAARGGVAAASAPGEAEAFLRAQGLSEADVAAISAKYPQVSTAGVDTVLRPKIALLKKQAGLSDPAKLGAVLSAQPRALLTASLERHLKPTVEFFTSSSKDKDTNDASEGLGMRKSSLARIATARPILLTYDVAEQLMPKVQFFSELGLTVAQIRRMVMASPDVLSIGIGNDLQPTVAWIKSLGIEGSDLANLLAHHPTIFHNPLHVAKENVKLLKGSSGSGDAAGAAANKKDSFFPAMALSEAQAAQVMLGAPVLFRRLLIVASMRAKLSYWNASPEKGGLGKAFPELASAPRFLERALKVTAPRLEFAKRISSGSLPRDIAALLEGPDDAFAREKLGAPGEEAAFDAFRSEWDRKHGGTWAGPK